MCMKPGINKLKLTSITMTCDMSINKNSRDIPRGLN